MITKKNLVIVAEKALITKAIPKELKDSEKTNKNKHQKPEPSITKNPKK